MHSFLLLTTDTQSYSVVWRFLSKINYCGLKLKEEKKKEKERKGGGKEREREGKARQGQTCTMKDNLLFLGNLLQSTVNLMMLSSVLLSLISYVHKPLQSQLD